MNDLLLRVDVLGDFEHEDGELLLRSFRERHEGLVAAIDTARATGVPVVYAQENDGVWNGDGVGLVCRALEGRAGDLVNRIAPRPGDRLVVKPRYSAFDWTPLELILRQLQAGRVLLAGTATEMCAVQNVARRETGRAG